MIGTPPLLLPSTPEGLWRTELHPAAVVGSVVNQPCEFSDVDVFSSGLRLGLTRPQEDNF